MSTIQSVQNLIDAQSAHVNRMQRISSTNSIDSIDVDPVFHHQEIETNSMEPEFSTNNNNNIVIEMPEITSKNYMILT